MSLPQEELLPIKDVANHLNKSETYVLSKLRRRQFQRVIIEKKTKSGAQWTASFYFDPTIWPYKSRKTEGDHHLLERTEKEITNETWLEDAANIYIPLDAVEAYKKEHEPSETGLHSSTSIKSSRLRAAMSAYREFYVLNKIDQTKGGHRKQIIEWLSRYPTLTQGEKESIAAVVNLDPRRGRK